MIICSQLITSYAIYRPLHHLAGTIVTYETKIASFEKRKKHYVKLSIISHGVCLFKSRLWLMHQNVSVWVKNNEKMLHFPQFFQSFLKFVFFKR